MTDTTFAPPISAAPRRSRTPNFVRARHYVMLYGLVPVLGSIAG